MGRNLRRGLLLTLVNLLSVQASAEEAITITIDCWAGGHCPESYCAPGVTEDYDCSNGHGGWTPQCPFIDPLPSGAQLTGIRAEL